MRKRNAIEVERGDVFEVPLEDGRRGYGQVLNATLLGFFAVATDQRLALGEIAQRPVAFRMSCSSAAIRNGTWPVVGRAPLSAEMAKPLRLYRNNGPDWWFLVEWTPDTGEVERRVPQEAVAGAESDGIWMSRDAATRLGMYFRGETCPWVKVAP